MSRFLVLFAREPAAQAREKGLASPGAAALFRDFARGWIEAAREAGAKTIVAAPAQDLPVWRRALPGGLDILWNPQIGNSLGERLEGSMLRAAALGGHAVVVGGDVPPCRSALRNAYESLEGGVEAALSPAHDGGVSLLALSPQDLGLLRSIRPRRRTVLRDLLRALRARGRSVRVLDPAPDLDGPRSVRALLRRLPSGDCLRRLLRSLLAGVRPDEKLRPASVPRRLFGSPCGLRAPPLALPS